MATEHIPQIDKLIKDFGKQFREDVKQASKAIEQAGKAIKKYQESRGKSMLHNVTVKHEENKVLEKYWLMRAMKKGSQSDFMISPSELHIGKGDLIIKEQELDHEPTPSEIAQFLSDAKADFVSVVQNYRFAGELPFWGKGIGDMEDWEKAVQEMVKIQSIKNEIDRVKNLEKIGDIVDALSPDDTKTLLKLYIYSK